MKGNIQNCFTLKLEISKVMSACRNMNINNN